MRLHRFRVTNYRNILDSDWINVCDVTAFVGQNEAGKSNLFEALYCLNPFVDETRYNADEDWPVDDWGGRRGAKGKLVCQAEFVLEPREIAALYAFAQPGEEAEDDEVEDDEAEDDEVEDDEVEDDESEEGGIEVGLEGDLPEKLLIRATRSYGYKTSFHVNGGEEGSLDKEAVQAWAKSHVPKFVYIHDYEMSGAQIELNELRDRWDQVGRENRYELSHEDQTILVILDLAQVDLDDFLHKSDSADGRTIRSFDKRAASKYLTRQFQKLWSQKKVDFDIEVDGPTLNIFAVDEEVGMPVRLKRRSTGFRWYVSFAWKFTHASAGEYANCILLLEEPGIHLHYSGQRDLLEVFDSLSKKNSVLYTTHLASMVDLANPERVRMVEIRNHHLAITEGVVSTQQAPMAVIETCLGLTPDLSGMLGNRQVLIVEGGTDALILHKLSGLLKSGGDGGGLSDHVYLWPAQTASKTPMYAAFAIGQRWDAGVLLDSDKAGADAKMKIEEMSLKILAENDGYRFRVLMLGEVAAVKKTDAAIEDLFPDDFYLNCVNDAFGVAIKPLDLPEEGSDMITARVEHVLKARHGHRALDKKRVLGEMLKRFDTWTMRKDLPGDTAKKAEKLFKVINAAFAKTG